MNLDDPASFSKLDTLDMLGQIDGLPDQLQAAWELGLTLPDPWVGDKPSTRSIRQVVLSGMGGTGIAADLLAAYLAPTCRLPVTVWRDYGLPAWAHGPATLVIASSHSGDTEETLELFQGRPGGLLPSPGHHYRRRVGAARSFCRPALVEVRPHRSAPLGSGIFLRVIAGSLFAPEVFGFICENNWRTDRLCRGCDEKTAANFACWCGSGP